MIASSSSSSSCRRRFTILFLLMIWPFNSSICVLATEAAAAAAAIASTMDVTRDVGCSSCRYCLCTAFQVQHYPQANHKNLRHIATTCRQPPPPRWQLKEDSSYYKYSEKLIKGAHHILGATKNQNDNNNNIMSSSSNDNNSNNINIIHLAEIDKLLRKMGHSLYNNDDELFQVERISGKGAFCNFLYKVTPSLSLSSSTTTLPVPWAVKIFSPLALERMDPTKSLEQQQQEAVVSITTTTTANNNEDEKIIHTTTKQDVMVDSLAADQNLAPIILATTRKGILMEYLNGRVLTEADVDGGSSLENDYHDYDDNDDYCNSKEESKTISQLAASAIAKLHQLQGPIFTNQALLQLQTRKSQSPHMLWRACHVMLQKSSSSLAATTSSSSSESSQSSLSFSNSINVISSSIIKSPRFWNDYNMEGWSLERLADTINMHQQELESNNDLLLTRTGHGDCKPCNLVLLTSTNTRKEGAAAHYSQESSRIKFIDLELAGLQYVAYDLAKFWRRTNVNNNNEPLTMLSSSYARNRRTFLQTYIDKTTIHASTFSNNMVQQHVDIQDLECQMQQLLPLTWLEAALFFACMANTTIGAATVGDSSCYLSHSPCSDKNNNVDQWMNLSLERLKSYEHCMLSSSGPSATTR